MEGRLYDATGKQCHSRRPELKLKSIVTTEFSLPLYDAFDRRTMSPYQWLYFDDVIPSEMRIDDITMALKNRGFRLVERRGDPENCSIVALACTGRTGCGSSFTSRESGIRPGANETSRVA